MTACKSSSLAYQLTIGERMPALYIKKSIFRLLYFIVSISLSTAFKSERSQSRHSQIPFYFLIYCETASNSSFRRSTRIIVEWYSLAISTAITFPIPMQPPNITTMLSDVSLRGFGLFQREYKWEMMIATTATKTRAENIV